jgi:hypothetical protein
MKQGGGAGYIHVSDRRPTHQFYVRHEPFLILVLIRRLPTSR